MRGALRVVMWLALFGVSTLVLFVMYITLTDYRPAPVEPVPVSANNRRALESGTAFTVTTFNTGYAGLDSTQDFFMDGGSRSRAASKTTVERNLGAISDLLKSINPEFILLQEVDERASRSYGTDQPAHYATTTSVPPEQYAYAFSTNYRVSWVPVPLANPMGSVHSGLMTLSRAGISSASRHQYPGLEPWPRRLFELDRCFLETRVPVVTADGTLSKAELVLINSHLSAFDEGGKIRKQQLDMLSAYIEKQYSEGHYVIVGGDWNHVLPGSDPSRFKSAEPWPFWLQKLPEDWSPKGFRWAADTGAPTVRTLEKPYVPGYNFRAVIDGFFVSANVQVLQVKTHDLEFANSDHNPVSATFMLK